MTVWTDAVIVFTSKGQITVRIAAQDVLKATADYSLSDFSECFIGGVPKYISERYAKKKKKKRSAYLQIPIIF